MADKPKCTMTAQHNGPKEFLGYGVYADCDGHAILLTQEDGQSSCTISLGPRVYRAFKEFADRYLGDFDDDDDHPVSTSKVIRCMDDYDDWDDDDWDDDWDDEDN